MGPGYLNLFNGRISITLNIVRLVDKDLHNSSKSKARWLYLNPRDLARADPDLFDPSKKKQSLIDEMRRVLMVCLRLIIRNVCFLTDHIRSSHSWLSVIYNQICSIPLRNFINHAPWKWNIHSDKCSKWLSLGSNCSFMIRDFLYHRRQFRLLPLFIGILVI